MCVCVRLGGQSVIFVYTKSGDRNVWWCVDLRESEKTVDG